MGGLFAPGANATLDSIEAYRNSAGTAAPVRLFVYQGGTSDTNPNGATLIAEGTVTLNTNPGWNTVVTSGETLQNNTRTFIGIKGNDTLEGIAYHTSSAQAGDFFATHGRIDLTGVTGTSDETIAMPATMDNTGATTGAFWYSLRINYTLASTHQIVVTAMSDIQ